MARPATSTSSKSDTARGLAKPLRGNAGSVASVVGKRPGGDFIEAVWTLFCSIRFAVALNVGLALAAMIGTVIPQMPPGIENFDLELSQFLAGAQARYGEFSAALYWAGFYNLYQSLWFRMLVVAVVFSIVMCTLNRWQPIMRQIRTPSLNFAESFISGLAEKATFRSVTVDLSAAEGALRAALRRSRYRVVSALSPDGKTVFVYADRDRWSKLVTFVSHAALVMVILTSAGMANLGWREQSVPFYPGRPVNVGHGTDFTVSSDNFSIDYYADGKTVKEYKDTLVVSKGGKDVLTKTVLVSNPLRYNDVSFFLVSYQPAVFARAKDDKGSDLPLMKMAATGPVTALQDPKGVLVEFGQTSKDNLPLDYVQLPVKDHLITLALTYYQDVSRQAGENPPVYAQAYVDKNFDKAVYDAFVPRNAPLRLPGFEQYSFSFTKDTTAILEVALDPGFALGAVFFTIMALGFTVSLYTSYARCWVRITVSEDRPGSVNVIMGGLVEKNKISFERDFERLAVRVRDRLADRVRVSAQASMGGSDEGGSVQAVCGR